MRAALIAHEHRIALRIIPRTVGSGIHLHQSAISILPISGRNTLRHNCRLRIFPNMDHFRAGIGLLLIRRQRNRIKFANRMISLQNDARILPRNRAAGLHLRPSHLGVRALTNRALGYKIVNPALAVLISRVPILNRAVFNRRVFFGDQFHNCRVQLVLIAHRSRAALEVTHISPLVRDNQRALKLAGLTGIYSKISAQFHRTAHSLRNVNETAVRKYRAI